ncbi:MAG TPA: AraC family transcriptional regulator [Nocardioides sp.]|nr:AraC family transcriptional regulator [Nocardioides sp.]
MRLEDALLLDAHGRPTDRHLALESRDWDEIRANTDDVYMPFRVLPSATGRAPRATNHTASVGSFTLSRFRYGTRVDLDDFAPEAGRGIVLTTLAGTVRHRDQHVTPPGQTFLVDISRAPYSLSADDDHDQLNLTFCHQDLADLHQRWYGGGADPRLWGLAFGLGGPGSSWLALLDYVVRGIAEFPEEVAAGRLGRRLEEMIGVHLLTEWYQRFGDAPRDAGAAPRYVSAAEDYLRAHARSAPTLAEVAAAVGVSVRALTLAFRRHRDSSPISYLRAVRMDGARADLLAAGPDATVSSVIAAWGYVNHGVFARSYAERFGELPSATLDRSG